MPKILQINSCANWGSTGKIAEQINQHLSRRGWETFFAYGREVNPSKSNLIHVGNKLSQAIALIEARLFDNDGLSSRIATRRLINRIKSIEPDIIHIHNLHGYYINYRLLFNYISSTNVPVVWTFHDTWPYTGHCGHYGSISCEKWKTQCASCPLTRKDYPKSLIDQSKRNFNLKRLLFTTNSNLHIVTVSNWQKHDVEQSFFRDKDIMVIHNGVDLNVFRPMEHKDIGRKRILGVASQWGPLKGLKDFNMLREVLPKEYEIVLVGLTRKQVSQLPKGIVGIERTESIEKLVELYSTATVFVNPTYADTFPTTNIEALACGTPVITYNTGGSPEALDNKTGVVVEKGDVLGISNAVHYISMMDRFELKKECRKRAMQLFDKNERYRDYIKLYEELL